MSTAQQNVNTWSGIVEREESHSEESQREIKSLKESIRDTENRIMLHLKKMAEKNAQWQAYLRECDIQEEKERKEEERQRKEQGLLWCAKKLASILCFEVFGTMLENGAVETPKEVNGKLMQYLGWKDVEEVLWEAEYSRDQSILQEASVLHAAVSLHCVGVSFSCYAVVVISIICLFRSGIFAMPFALCRDLAALDSCLSLFLWLRNSSGC